MRLVFDIYKSLSLCGVWSWQESYKKYKRSVEISFIEARKIYYEDSEWHGFEIKQNDNVTEYHLRSFSKTNIIKK